MTFGHLGRWVSQRHHSPRRTDQSLWRNENFLPLPEDVVETVGHLSRKLQMLCLVVTNRNMGSLVYQNIRSLKHRIREQPKLQFLIPVLLVRGLIFPLCHSAQVSSACLTAEDPHQFRVGGYVALVEDGATLGVQANGKHHGKRFLLPLSQLFGVLSDGNSV